MRQGQDFYNCSYESFDEVNSMLAVKQYIQQNIKANCYNIDKTFEPPESQVEDTDK